MTADSQTPESELFVHELTGAQGSLYAFILSILPDREAARDVLQETNIVLWRKAAEFTPGTSFTAWSFSIARNKVLSYHRDQGRERVVFSDALMTTLADDAASDSVHANAEQLALEECVDELPKKKRQLIAERYSAGGSVKEMAKTHNRSASSLSVTLSRIRSELMECIENRLAEEENA
ncbi:MAG: sigma-70 family RNA polymerase sigma factor [Pirellulales bacterium]|nr:sigma-70 family RNA polymerase sigma factor [Pirellulales bacterium]